MYALLWERFQREYTCSLARGGIYSTRGVSEVGPKTEKVNFVSCYSLISPFISHDAYMHALIWEKFQREHTFSLVRRGIGVNSGGVLKPPLSKSETPPE
jgi:hypothetical protein